MGIFCSPPTKEISSRVLDEIFAKSCPHAERDCRDSGVRRLGNGRTAFPAPDGARYGMAPLNARSALVIKMPMKIQRQRNPPGHMMIRITETALGRGPQSRSP